MTLQQLRVLVAVVEARSFTRGARTLFMTQSAASQHVRALEQSLRTSLVNRAGGEVVATHAGEALVGYARELLRLAAEAERSIGALRDGTAGHIVLGASGSAVYLVPPLVAGFRAAYPGIEVALEVRPRGVLRAAITRGAVDVALMSGGEGATPRLDGETRGRDTLVAVPVCPDRLVLAVSPASPLLQASALAPYPLERLAEETIVAQEDPSPSWRLVERWAATHGVDLRPALRLDNPDAVKKSVEAGMGIAFLSLWVVEREVALGTLRLVPLRPEAPTRHYELVYRQARLGRGLPPSPSGEPAEIFRRFAAGFLAGRLPAGISTSPGVPSAPGTAGAFSVPSADGSGLPNRWLSGAPIRPTSAAPANVA